MTATSAQEPAIRIHGLTKSYSELEVLRGVDFEVARGSIFALLGSNGAGKTTVVKIVSTLLKADAGEATVNGFEVAGQAAEVRKSISLTGQFAAVDEILSGRENRSMDGSPPAGQPLRQPGTARRRAYEDVVAVSGPLTRALSHDPNMNPLPRQPG
jgi:ABC-type sugar transport system ATPase subunit